jgi:hypothetical protein
VRSTDWRSPMVDALLHSPRQSAREELDRHVQDQFVPYLIAAAVFLCAAAEEWLAARAHAPRQPGLYSVMAAVAIAVCGWQYARLQRRAARLRLSRDGERLVGRILEDMRAEGALVFHDIPCAGFNLDHVVLSTRGFFVIETKTWTRPARGRAWIGMTQQSVTWCGRIRAHSEKQVQAGARALERLLGDSTGKRYPVRGVLLFPGWRVSPMDPAWRRTPELPWVLEPKALAGAIAREPARVAAGDLSLAAEHLARYMRSRPD